VTLALLIALVLAAAFGAWRMRRKAEPEASKKETPAEHWEGVFRNYWSGGRK
jgi:hypothetical protein